MEKVTEQFSKEEMYRAEIFKLLHASLGHMTETELTLLQDLFMQEKISEEELLKRIIEQMEIDYKLKILGEKTEYLPRPELIQPLLNSDKKIFEITAGNGFGKTFLLNLFAYAFYADKLGNESILKTLKERVSDYSNQDAYNLKYKLSFNLPNGEKIILSKVKNAC